MLKIYLAGKTRGSKWRLVESYRQSMKVTFVSSDRQDSDYRSATHGCTERWQGHILECGRDKAPERAVSLIEQCDLLIAILDDVTAYGTIAELAWAAAKGKRCYAIALSDIDGIDDAVWFATSFPYVTRIDAADLKEAQKFIDDIVALESPMESALYAALIRNHLAIEVRPQYPFGPYRLDFAFPKYRLAVEVDGHQFHSSREQREKDGKRDRYLTSKQWRTVRFTGTEVNRDADQCATEISKLLTKARPRRVGSSAFGGTPA